MYATLEPVLHKLGGGGGGGDGFLEDKTSVPDIFSSCLFIPRAHFERGLMMVSCYGYEI